MDRKVHPDTDQLLLVIQQLLKAPDEHPPFESFLHCLENSFGFSFAALYLNTLEPTRNPLIICPSRERLNLPADQADYLVTYEKLPETYNKVISLRDTEGHQTSTNPYFQTFLKPNSLDDVLVLNVRNPSTVQARLVVGVDKQQKNESANQKLFLEALTPYLISTLRTFTRRSYLESKSQLYDEIVSRVGVGEIRLNSQGKIIYTNTLADALLHESHLLSQLDGKLYCQDQESNTNLQVALSRYLDEKSVPPSEPVFLHSTEPFDVVSLLIRQLPNLQDSPDDELKAAVGIYIANHTRRTEYFVELLAKLFDFSNAEARVAIHLAQGFSVNDTAEQLHLSPNTVRTHISRMYDKTGIRREAALVSLLMRTLAGTWMDPKLTRNDTG